VLLTVQLFWIRARGQRDSLLLDELLGAAKVVHSLVRCAQARYRQQNSPLHCRRPKILRLQRKLLPLMRRRRPQGAHGNDLLTPLSVLEARYQQRIIPPRLLLGFSPDAQRSFE